MPSYAVVPASAEHVAAMLPQVRQADRDEVWAAYAELIEVALPRSLVLSTHAWAGLVDEQVACVFGVAPVNLLAGHGAPWMVGTALVERHAFAFLRRNRQYVATMRSTYNRLENWVDARNSAAISWLGWLGFEFDQPMPYGPFGQPFMRFVMRNKPCA